MTELLVGTRKGLFVLDGEPGVPFAITRRVFAGEPVDYAMRDAGSGRVFAAVSSPFYGPRVWYADGLCGEWRPARGVALPRVTSHDRVVPDGRVLVWETRDAGATWTAHGEGLPRRDAYLQVLRQAFAATGEGAGLQLYFGASSGELFGSADAGASWFTAARRLPAIASVRVAS